MGLSVVILAAGNGKRMMSSLPKVLHPLGGTPLLVHVFQTAQSLTPDSIFVVYGGNNTLVRQTLADLDVTWVEQDQPRGTGHALLQALSLIPAQQRVLVLYGDVPLIKTKTLQDLLASSTADELSLLVANVPNPTGLGRILRNDQGQVVAIVEHKDATAQELLIQEINTGILVAPAKYLKKWLPKLKNQNSQGEFYLTDIVSTAVAEKIKIHPTVANCNTEISGVNDRKELIKLERHYQLQLANEFLINGVTIVDPQRFDCRGQAVIAKDVQIDVNVILEGKVVIEEGCTIGPNNFLKNVRIGKNTEIKANCVIEDAMLGERCIIGPFARIRPQTQLGDEVHIGNFVELKKTSVAAQSKVNHLTYLGDAIVGENVNVGAGTITCNYDGVHKFTTIIKDKAFIGSGTELVAPVTVGEGAYIGAGSTITQNAPDNLLTLGRAKQVTIKGWKKKLKDETK